MLYTYLSRDVLILYEQMCTCCDVYHVICRSCHKLSHNVNIKYVSISTLEWPIWTSIFCCSYVRITSSVDRFPDFIVSSNRDQQDGGGTRVYCSTIRIAIIQGQGIRIISCPSRSVAKSHVLPTCTEAATLTPDCYRNKSQHHSLMSHMALGIVRSSKCYSYKKGRRSRSVWQDIKSIRSTLLYCLIHVVIGRHFAV